MMDESDRTVGNDSQRRFIRSTRDRMIAQMSGRKALEGMLIPSSPSGVLTQFSVLLWADPSCAASMEYPAHILVVSSIVHMQDAGHVDGIYSL